MNHNARMLYLVRHGEAIPDGPLTDRGVAAVERVAAWAARTDVSVKAIHHSGKRRAQQTADLFAARLHAPVSAIAGISPNDEPLALALPDTPCMIVSHLPFLANLTAALTRGAPVVFHPCTLVALTRAEDRYAIEWVVHPGIV